VTPETPGKVEEEGEGPRKRDRRDLVEQVAGLADAVVALARAGKEVAQASPWSWSTQR
jgi:hypothetical protein